MHFESTKHVRQWVTHTAQTWKQHKKLSPREFDDFTYCLERCPEDSSPILWLLNQGSPFLDMLTLWYGPTGLGSNLIRMGILPYTQRLSTAIETWRQNTAQHAKRNFNRLICVGDQEGFDANILYSSILGDLAELLTQTEDHWRESVQKISSLHPCTLAGVSELEEEIDLEIATSLGFNGVHSNKLPMHFENALRQNLNNHIQVILQWTQSFYLEITGSSDELPWSNAMMHADELSIHTQRLASLKIPTHSHLGQWDHFRENIEKTFCSVVTEFEKFSEAFCTALQHLDSQVLTERKPFPGSIQRRVAWDHIETGLGPRQAIMAVSELAEYLDKNHMAPHQLLDNEAQHIHPGLNTQTLTRITNLQKEHSQHPKEKKRLMASLDLLSKTMIIFLCMGLAGCGVKGNPVNDVIEPRPEFPWKELKVQVEVKPSHEG